MREHNRRYSSPHTQRRQMLSYDELEQTVDAREATSLMGKLKQIKPTLRKMNTFIERSFPNTADDIAHRLVALTPRALAISYGLLVLGVIASQLKLIWQDGYMWGIASLAVAMVGVFLWISSSTIMILPDMSDQTRALLRRTMRLQASSFMVALLTFGYFLGMVSGWW
jgi:hypothetical protein